MNPFKGKANNGQGVEVPEAGTHPAALVALVDLGSHEDEYNGEKKTARKVMLAWELTAEKQSGSEHNHIVSKEYSLSFHKKGKLRLACEAVRGKAYSEDEEIDYTKLLGQPCLVTVEVAVSAGGNSYAKVTGVTRPAKGMPVPAPKRRSASWFLDGADLSGLEAIGWLPYLYGRPAVEVVKESKEYLAVTGRTATRELAPDGAPAGESGDEQEIPF